jgi:RNA polymerase sigma factor (sigma-70 family)
MLVDNEGEIFQPLFTTPQAYGTLIAAAREITDTRNILAAHGMAEPDSVEIERVQQLIEELLPIIQDAREMAEKAESATTEQRRAARDGERGLSPEESLVLTIFGETHRSGQIFLDVEKHRELAERIEHAFEVLTPREARILRLRFGLGNGSRHTLKEVGQKLDVTGERIRQIEARALAKLRRPATGTRLREYVNHLIPESESSQREPLASGGSRPFVATFGLGIEEVLASRGLPPNAPTEYPHLCDWLEVDLRERLRDAIGEFRQVGPSKRDGETLSVRITFEWQQDGLPELEPLGWWSVLELAPFEEVYPGQDVAHFWDQLSAG